MMIDSNPGEKPDDNKALIEDLVRALTETLLKAIQGEPGDLPRTLQRITGSIWDTVANINTARPREGVH